MSGLVGRYYQISSNQGAIEESIEAKHPELHRKIRKLVFDAEQFAGVPQDTEITWDTDFDDLADEGDLDSLWDARVHLLQSRPMVIAELGVQKKLLPDRLDNNLDTKIIGYGKPISPNAAVGRVLDARSVTASELAEAVGMLRKEMEAAGEKDLDVILLFDYVTDKDSVKISIEGVGGVLNTRVGVSSHAGLIARRLGEATVSTQF